MKSEAKMANNGGQFWTLVSVPYPGLCVSFSLQHDFLDFWRVFFGNTHKNCLQKIEMSLRISNIFQQSQIELQVIYFHENKLLGSRET